ncbi:hypothetical protein BD410DRAFT_801732 [Rickenella mellea]|uniref:Gti1/Pac2 family-domain-containing protein n=1 Tax=Rickenella mellea TaxID=50990 RepID=A0A4Y7QC68_9AGAM|nr:hypothetical protein BD410DRAFT_801732 [Rickenella mellea]
MFYAPAQDMQRPTHPRLHVRDARDAQTVFEAVRRGVLKSVSRRLNEVERNAFIQSGAIFVWEESDDELGLKRWTDGRIWSQSRMREPYLFYDEKVSTDGSDDATNKSRTQAVFRFVDGTSRNTGSSSILSHFDRTAHRPPGLVKQAYSAWVLDPPNSRPRKWHLTAYFTYADLQSLPTIDNDPTLRSITVPAGVYRSGKARSRKDSDLDADTPRPYATSSSASSTPPRTPSGTSKGSSSSRTLPPLLTAVAREGATSTHAISREQRFAEDQRMIQMLNSRHVR